MSKNTLCDAIKNLELQYQLTPYQKNKLDEFISLLTIGDFIYPGSLKSKLFIDIQVVYQMLELLKNEGYLTTIYEVYCFECSHSKGIFLNSISEFNEDYCCDFCGTQLNPFDNLIVLYKVINI